MALTKVISGGQTGVDRAALDVAFALGFEIGGWCPKGRLAEDGTIPDAYPLWETRSEELHVRTQRNVESSTATLIVSRGALYGSTRFTAECAASMRRPLLVVDLTCDLRDPVEDIALWLRQVRPTVLNVAGPRESGAPGIYDGAMQVLTAAFQTFNASSELVRAPTALTSRSDRPHVAL